MGKSVTIRFPEDGDTITSADFTVDGVVSARMDPVDLTLTGSGMSTVVSADGRWSFDYMGIADGNYTLTAVNSADNSITHAVDFAVAAAVSMVSARVAKARAKPAAKKKPQSKARAAGKKRRRTV